MENAKSWLLVADASKARLYSLYKARLFQDPSAQHLELVGQFTHDESRKKGSELTTDRMGEFGSGTFVEATNPKFHEAEFFALELLKLIESGRKDGSFRDLIIVAPATFMGLLHKHMPDACSKMVSQKIEKDYTQYEGKQLIDSLMHHF